MSFVFGRLRIQLLSETVVRLEEYGPNGFEDRATFNVVNRDWPGVRAESFERDGLRVIRTSRIEIVASGERVSDVRIFDCEGRLLFENASSVSSRSFLPAPSERIDAWALADDPRIVPPPWGALPPPAEFAGPAAGWDLENQARDVYVFIPGGGGYRQLVRDLIRLTGPVPLPPLSSLGLINSRYYPYRQDEALADVDDFIRRDIPLDIMVLDTDWRVGASHGYGVNTELFPNLKGFVEEAHKRGVRIMLNDHPEPVAETALDLKELEYRKAGLTSLLDLGADFWWFDRNWHVTLRSPADGLTKEVFGMRVYHDIVQAHSPRKRPMIMSNAEGIDNGFLNAPPSPAAHRYPIWWTGDTRAAWEYLARGVRNAVVSGTRSLLPYLSEDLGGHHDTPDDELYVRFVQYGALSPICRLHCSWMLCRFPWAYGEDASSIAADYIRLRRRLAPTLYSAARDAFEQGLPIVRRCDLYWPEYREAESDTQYLLGPDLLVAPILEAAVPLAPVPHERLHTAEGKSGVQAEYFSNNRLSGEAVCQRHESHIKHGWFGRNPAPGVDGKDFSAVWTGFIGPIDHAGLHRIGVRTDDGARLWLNGELLIDELDRRGTVYKWVDIALEAGENCSFRLEYRSFGTWNTMCELLWGRHDRGEAAREVWIPPGMWHDVWSGKAMQGPADVEVSAPLQCVPMFARAGGMLISAPQPSTDRAAWTDVEVDLFASPDDFTSVRELYEDDGQSIDYLSGVFRKTQIVFSRSGTNLAVMVHPQEGSYAPGERRRWRFRIHGLTSTPKSDGTWIERAGTLALSGMMGAKSTRPAFEFVVEQDDTATPVAIPIPLSDRLPILVPPHTAL